ncbi:hypothetical protein quinque_006833 [Culex quinquefasciatus]
MQIRRKHGTFRAGLKSLVVEYCSESSVHGVHYFRGSERTWYEKLVWILVFALSVGSCFWLIHEVYHKWSDTPVIVSFAEKSTPVWQIPFPAITICPEVKTSYGEMNFTRQYLNYVGKRAGEQRHDNGTDSLLAIMQLCERSIYDRLLNQSQPFPDKISGESYGSIIRRMKIPLKDIVLYCSFQNNWIPCEKLFSYTMTDEGVCVTFNALSASDMLRKENLTPLEPYLSENKPSEHWSQDGGYTAQSDLDSYPYRALRPGQLAGLKVFLRSDRRNHDFLCRGALRGFKALLHPNNEYPQLTSQFVRIPMNQDVNIAVKPQIITTTPGLHHYSPERRQCFFNHERYLQFFREYTQDNCELECLTNFTLSHCGCVRFSMPRNGTTPECETNQMECMMGAEQRYLEMDFRSRRGDEPINYHDDCNCLPGCASVQYDLEITQTDFDWKGWLQNLNRSTRSADEGIELALFEVYYKEAQFMTSKRSELYGLTDFLANCGGLLGLCMGVSLLSLVELVYFCVVRPVTLWRRRREQVNEEEQSQGISMVARDNDD